MKKSKILFLLISLWQIVVFSSCSSHFLNGMAKVPQKMNTVHNLWFVDTATDYIYRVNIQIYKKKLSGIFIAKKTDSSTHRIVFTSEFGNKLLDMEISDNGFRINSVVEELNHKMVLNLLQRDIFHLLKESYQVKKQWENDSITILEAGHQMECHYIFLQKKNGLITHILHARKHKVFISIDFMSENNIIANKVIIRHHNIPLAMEFTWLKS